MCRSFTWHQADMIDPDPRSYATLCYAVTDTSFHNQASTVWKEEKAVWKEEKEEKEEKEGKKRKERKMNRISTIRDGSQ